MRKLVTIFCFIAFCSPAFAQDTTKPATDANCDVITLKSGKHIYCKVQEIGKSAITYTDCNNIAAQPVNVVKDSVRIINYPNGTFLNIVPVPVSAPKKRLYNPYVSITGGVGYPLSSFKSPGPLPDETQGKVDNQSSYAGYSDALKGFNVNVSFGSPIDRRVGIRTELGYQYNPFDVNAYVRVPGGTAANLPGSREVNIGTDPNIVNVSANGGYTTAKVLIGLELVFPVKIVTFSLNAMFGGTFNSFPGTISYKGVRPPTVTTGDSLEFIEVRTSSCFGYAFQFGGGVKVDLSSTISAAANLDFYTGTANFPVEITQSGNVNNMYISNYNATNAIIKYYLVNINLGLVYNFGK